MTLVKRLVTPRHCLSYVPKTGYSDTVTLALANSGKMFQRALLRRLPKSHKVTVLHEVTWQNYEG